MIRFTMTGSRSRRGETLPGDRWRVPVALPVVAQNKQQPSAIPAKGKT